MLRPKKIHTRNLIAKKKILAAQKFPTPRPIIFLMIHLLLAYVIER